MQEIIAYKSIDGTIFMDANLCREHEEKYTSQYIEMWKYNGEKTQKAGNAILVHIIDNEVDNFEQIGALWFIDQCKVEGSSSEGIVPTAFGWFIWSEPNERFFEVDNDMAFLIREYVV